jgi:general secretion pathway protein N
MKPLDRCLALLLAAFLAAAAWRAAASFGEVVAMPPAAAAKAIPAARAERGQAAVAPAAGWPRPLFAPAGAAQASAESSSKRPAPDDEIPRLIGVALDGDRRVVLLAHNSTVLRLRQGERIGNWTVTEIAVRSAVVRKGEQSQNLRLDP